MKNNLGTFFSISILFFTILFSSCDKMNDIQEEFASREEAIYLGKVDSIETFSGFGSIKLTWYINGDPKIDQTIIYWNQKRDSVVKEFKRSKPGVTKDSIVIDNLPEGTIQFDFRNVNKKGEKSLWSSAAGVSWGPEFANGLFTRDILGFNYNLKEETYTLNLSETERGDSVIYSQIIYTDTQGNEKDVKIDRGSNEVLLENFPDGEEFQLRTVFFLPEGIDTVFSEYKEFHAPKAIFENGLKLNFQGDNSNEYFTGKDSSSFYEWNTDGDVKRYELLSDGTINETEHYSSAFPKEEFRTLFFYDDDKFIAISTDNGVFMFRKNDTDFSQVGGQFGSSFNYPTFVGGQGFFYSVSENEGELKTWFAKNDASWDSPNGILIGEGYSEYDPLVMFENQILLGVDAVGALWSFPVKVSGNLGVTRRIGEGWDKFEQIIGIGSDLIGVDEGGHFYLFKDFDTQEKFWAVD